MQSSRRQFALLVCSAAAVGAIGKVLTAPTPRGRGKARGRKFSPPPLQEVPWPIVPIAGLEDLVPVARIADLLKKLTPCWNAIKVSLVIHALRLWGRDATFTADRFHRAATSRLFSGADLLAFFLKHEFYQEAAIGGPPLFIPAEFGLRGDYSPPEVNDFTGQLSHRDDFLQVCADLGLPLSTPISTQAGMMTLRQVLLSSVAEFGIDGENEWSAEVFARYLAPCKRWTNAAGEPMDFDRLTTALADQPLGKGACLGTHVEFALSVLLQVNDRCSILSPASVTTIRKRLSETSSLLSSTAIAENGAWSGNWSGREATIPKDTMSQLSTRIMSTGHHLEWLAIAPADIRPVPSVIADAALAALDDAARLTAFQREGGYIQLSHLARALCLMKRRTPEQMIEQSGS